jgi:hypothetical protein
MSATTGTQPVVESERSSGVGCSAGAIRLDACDRETRLQLAYARLDVLTRTPESADASVGATSRM